MRTTTATPEYRASGRYGTCRVTCPCARSATSPAASPATRGNPGDAATLANGYRPSPDHPGTGPARTAAAALVAAAAAHAPNCAGRERARPHRLHAPGDLRVHHRPHVRSSRLQLGNG